MIPDDLAGVSTFLAVAESRSFSRAAAALGVSASAVSQAISRIERRLGVALFHRTTRSVGLTEAGSQLLVELAPVARSAREALERARASARRPVGTLRLSVSRVASRLFVEPALPGLLAQHPELRVELVAEDAFTDLAAAGLDAGIRLGESLERDMVAVRISGPQRVAIVASPAYFRRRPPPRHPRDLLAHDCITFRSGTTGRVLEWDFVDGDRDLVLSVGGRVVCNDPDSMIRAAVAGLGVAHVLESMVAAQLRARTLQRALAKFCPPFPGFYLYFPSRRELPLKTRVLVEALRADGARPRPSGARRGARS